MIFFSYSNAITRIEPIKKKTVKGLEIISIMRLLYLGRKVTGKAGPPTACNILQGLAKKNSFKIVKGLEVFKHSLSFN